jgi:thioredoxin-related protein
LKRIALAAAIALLVVPQTFAGITGWQKSIATAQKLAKDKNQLIFVDLFAQWCGWCHRFEAEVFPSQVFQQATGDMILLRLDTEDGNEGTRLAQKFNVSSLPTFLVLTPDMTLAGIIRGYAAPNEFVSMLKDTRTKHETFMQLVKTEKTFGKDYQKRLDLARQFQARSAFSDSEPRLKKLTTEKGVPVSIRDAAYYDLAVAQILQKKYIDTLATTKALIALSKSGEPVERSYLLQAQVYLEMGNLAAARDQFRKFKKLYPTSPLNANVDVVLPDLERRLGTASK